MGLDRTRRMRAGTADPDPPGARPLLVTADPELLDELLKLAAAGCGEVDVAPDAVGARAYWTAAPLVVIGTDAAVGCARARLPRRRNVVLASRTGPDGMADERAWDTANALGADHVVVLPPAAGWLTERFATVDAGPPATGRVVGVIGGRGGAGASTLATALAVTAARAGHRTMLVDADPLGGGLDLVLGWEGTGGLRWPELAEARGRVSVPSLYRALPGQSRFVLVSWDRGPTLELAPDAMDAALDAGCRGSDLVVVDLPRRLDEAAIRAAQLADPVLLLVPADLRGCAAAARVSAQIRPHCRDIQVVARGPAPGGLRPAELARALGLSLAGSLRPERGLEAALERSEAPAGQGSGPLATLCRKLLVDLGLTRTAGARPGASRPDGGRPARHRFEDRRAEDRQSERRRSAGSRPERPAHPTELGRVGA